MTKVVLTAEERRRANREAQRRYRERHGLKVHTEQGVRSQCAKCGAEFFAARQGVRVCGPGDCERVLAKAKHEPFTVEHFERWARGVVLDTGKPWKVESFQADFLQDVFDGVPECWLLIAEGNTKTTTLAGLALYHCQYHPVGRVPIAAAARDQAFLMYLQAQGMVFASPGLQPVFNTHEGLREIRVNSQDSRLNIYASDERTGDGVIFTLALVDELHRHRDLRLYRTWAGKLDKREGAQLAGISTAGEPGSEFEAARQSIRQGAHERQVRPGYVRAASPGVVLHEYALPEGGDPADLKQVKLANPFSGVTLATLQRKLNSPTMTPDHWQRLTCNVATRSAASGVSETEWAAQKSSVEIPVGEPVWAGLDVAWRQDTTALVPLWVRDREFRLFGPATILEPPMDGSSIDPDDVERALQDLHTRNPIATLVMDTTRAEQLAVWAERTLGCEVVDRPQTNALAALDYKRWIEAMSARWLWHTGDPGLTRHVLAGIVRRLPSDQLRFDRPAESRTSPELNRIRWIDALTAASQVHGVAAAELLVEPEEAHMPHFAWA